MGSLIYGTAPAILIEDRVLKHLQAVIVDKLRRHESFTFNWDFEADPATPARPGAHGTIWISEAAMLYFTYDGPRGDRLNPAWLSVLTQEASSSRGLSALPEPPSPPGATARR